MKGSLCLLLMVVGVASSACGPMVKRVTVSSAAEIFQDGQAAFYREGDLQLAEQALASNLKLIEVLLQTSPDNHTLLLLAAQGFSAYTFAFVEDNIAAYRTDPELARLQRERASRLYLRGRDYGLRLLELRRESFATALHADLPPFREALQVLQVEDVPCLFWAAYGWAGSINWSRDRPEMVAEFPRVVAMMRRALELNEEYFYAGPHLFFGVYYASRSPALGGNPTRAKFHLDKALELTGGTFLLVRLFFADPYAIQIQDRVLFERQLRLILDAPDDVLPEQRLMNQVAKARARLLLERIDELFLQ